MRGDNVQPRSQPQVEGIAQHDARADGPQIRGTHGFHRTIGSHRHEHRCFDDSVCEMQPATPRLPIPGQNLEAHFQATTRNFALARSISIASP